LAPNWTLRGSPTDSGTPKFGAGFVGYAPGPELPCTVTTFVRLVRLKPSTSPSTRARRPSTNARLSRMPTVKKSGPMPALRGMNWPSTTGRPAVPWIVVTPEGMLNGSAEYACMMRLNWKPETVTAPWPTRRRRWSSSDRPQSLSRSKGSIGELKKNSPTFDIAFEYVYETRYCPHFDGRCTNETCMPWYCERARGEYWLLFAYVGVGRQPLLVPVATHDGTFWLIEMMRPRPFV